MSNTVLERIKTRFVRNLTEREGAVLVCLTCGTDNPILSKKCSKCDTLLP